MRFSSGVAVDFALSTGLRVAHFFAMSVSLRGLRLSFWVLGFGLVAGLNLAAQPAPKTRVTYSEAYGKTGKAPEVSAQDLPRFAPVEPAKALETFQVKKGFRLELVAAEPAQRVEAAQARREPVGDLGEQLVAGEMAEVQSFLLGTGTFGFAASALSSVAESGTVYGVGTPEFRLKFLIEKANEALRSLGDLDNVDTTTLKSNIYAFVFDQKGLMAGLSLQGQKISKIK